MRDVPKAQGQRTDLQPLPTDGQKLKTDVIKDMGFTPTILPTDGQNVETITTDGESFAKAQKVQVTAVSPAQGARAKDRLATCGHRWPEVKNRSNSGYAVKTGQAKRHNFLFAR